MKRFICTLSVIFALLPITASADSPHYTTEISTPLYKATKTEPLPTPPEVAPVDPVPVPEPAPAAPTPSTGNCGDNFYKQYIYSHESGCDTNRYNSIGCYGIGQACPASKIAQCGADFACQDEWFSSYAVSSYGSWAGAYQHWLNYHWW